MHGLGLKKAFEDLAKAFVERQPRTSFMDKEQADALGLDVSKFPDGSLLMVEVDENGETTIKQLKDE